MTTDALAQILSYETPKLLRIHKTLNNERSEKLLVRPILSLFIIHVLNIQTRRDNEENNQQICNHMIGSIESLTPVASLHSV